MRPVPCPRTMKRPLFAAFLTIALALPPLPARTQSGLVEVPLGFCSLSSMSAATLINTTTCSVAAFTGTGSGTNLTASAVTGPIVAGTQVAGTGVPSGTYIVSQKSGTPFGAGVYNTSVPTTASSASLTTGGIPVGANYAVICAYTQAVNYRDDGGVPTGTAGSGGQGIAAGQCIPYNGTFSLLQFIQQTSGAILGISFYR